MKIPEKPPVLTEQDILANIQDYVDQAKRNAVLRENQDYPYWDKIKNKYKENALSMWGALKIFRTTSLTMLSFQDTRFSYSINERMHQLLHQLDMELGGKIHANEPISDHVRESILVSTVMEEAISSSILEGAVTTKRAAREMIRKQMKPRNKTEHMIINNFKTLAMIKSLLVEELSVPMIQDLHESITRNTLRTPELEGQLRTSNDVTVADVTTGEDVFQPPDFGILDSMLMEFVSWVNSDGEPFVHPIIKASIIHFMIGYIHPFVDGNGRTARTLFYWYLLKKGYWMIEYTAISSVILKESASYYKAFLYSEQDDLDLGYFLIHSLKTLQKALQLLHKYIEKKTRERRNASSLQHLTELNERQKVLVNKLRYDPHIRMDTNEYQFRFSVTYETARKDLLKLTEHGFLQMNREGKKKMIFARSKRFDELVKGDPGDQSKLFQ